MPTPASSGGQWPLGWSLFHMPFVHLAGEPRSSRTRVLVWASRGLLSSGYEKARVASSGAAILLLSFE